MAAVQRKAISDHAPKTNIFTETTRTIREKHFHFSETSFLILVVLAPGDAVAFNEKRDGRCKRPSAPEVRHPPLRRRLALGAESMKPADGSQCGSAPRPAKRSRRKARPTAWQKWIAALPVWAVALVIASLALAMIVGGVVVNVDRIDIRF
jgi:hypothetical protein